MKLWIKKTIHALTFILPISILTIPSHAYALDHIKIISVEPSKYSGDDYGMELDKACKKWHLNKKQASKIFYLSEKTTFMEIDLSYVDILHCEISGKLILKGQILDFHINAGSSSSISTKKDTIYYVCKKKQCKKYFF